jgi:hypothetical protein
VLEIMRPIRLCILSLLLPLIGGAPAPVVAANPPSRLALIIANSTYEVLPPLPQCPPAARNMAAALRDAGFEVSEAYEVTNAAFNAALVSFARKAPPQSVLIAYYCGYLAVFNDRGFLVPVAAELAAPDRIMTEGIAATALINVMIRADPHQGVAILDVAPALGKSDPVTETTFPIGDPPPAAMLAIAQPAPGGPGNVLAERLRSPVVNLRTLLESARADWGGQPGTILALTATPPPEDVYLRGQPPRQPAPTPVPATASTAPGSIETSDVESQMSRPERRRVQARLRALGYYQGDVDAVFGARTRDAIRRYQSAKGLPQTGRLGATEASQLLFFDERQTTP